MLSIIQMRQIFKPPIAQINTSTSKVEIFWKRKKMFLLLSYNEVVYAQSWDKGYDMHIKNL